MEMNFDPMTGEPIQNNTNNANMNFDPMTGQPVMQNTSAPVNNAFPKWAMIAIPVVATVIVAVVLVVCGVFQSKATKIALAFSNTFAQQPYFVEDLKLDDITKWINEKKVTMSVEMEADGGSIDAVLGMNPSEVRFSGNLAVDSIPETDFIFSYTPTALKAQLPALSDVIFVYNYTETPSGDMFEEYDEDDIEMINDALSSYWTESNANIQKRTTRALMDIMKEIEIEKLDSEKFEIDGKDRKCAGYSFEVTSSEVLDLLDAIETIYEEELEEDMFEVYEEMFSELRGAYREFPDTEVEVYIYKNKLACLNIVMDDVDTEMECLFKGGDFRWQNMELVLKDDYGSYTFELVGKVKDKKETYELSFEDDEIITFEYNRKNGEFELDIDGFGFEGNLASEKNSVTLSGDLEGVDCVISITRGAEFEELSGEEFDFGEADYDEFEDLLEDNEDLLELFMDDFYYYNYYY